MASFRFWSVTKITFTSPPRKANIPALRSRINGEVLISMGGGWGVGNLCKI